MQSQLVRTSLRVGACVLLTLTAVAAHAGCYSIYNSRGVLQSRSSDPQVDMSYQLHRTVPKKFGRNASMVFESPASAGRCVEYSRRAQRRNVTSQDTDEILQNMADRYAESAPYASGRGLGIGGWGVDIK